MVCPIAVNANPNLPIIQAKNFGIIFLPYSHLPSKLSANPSGSSLKIYPQIQPLLMTFLAMNLDKTTTICLNSCTCHSASILALPPPWTLFILCTTAKGILLKHKSLNELLIHNSKAFYKPILFSIFQKKSGSFLSQIFFAVREKKNRKK